MPVRREHYLSYYKALERAQTLRDEGRVVSIKRRRDVSMPRNMIADAPKWHGGNYTPEPWPTLYDVSWFT